jgi:hypothetical protein
VRRRGGGSAYHDGASKSGRPFEPVSAETQPVSGQLPIQISDIEKSPSRDSLRISPPSVRDIRISSPETEFFGPNLPDIGTSLSAGEETPVAGWGARIRTAVCRIRTGLSKVSQPITAVRLTEGTISA